ncbi:MAG: hypothetical protein MJZ18_08725 [Bacteroidales bacterium]|nr:hypothetical protein [Bacteroidales bacterium]
MKKLFFAAAIAALVLSSCSKKQEAKTETPAVEAAAPVVEKVLSFTEKTLATLNEIQTQLAEANTADAVKAVAEKLNAVREDVKANAATLSEDEKNSLNALFQTVATACQAKEALTK